MQVVAENAIIEVKRSTVMNILNFLLSPVKKSLNFLTIQMGSLSTHTELSYVSLSEGAVAVTLPSLTVVTKS